MAKPKPDPRSNQRSDTADAWAIITDFLRIRSRGTSRTYTSVLKEWCAFLGAGAGSAAGAARLVSATRSDVERYLSEAGGSSATVSKKHTILKQLYGVLSRKGALPDENPLAESIFSKPSPVRARNTEPLDLERVRALLHAPDLTHPKGLRDRAILALLFGTAIRRGELCTLKVGSIRLTPNGRMVLRRERRAGAVSEHVLPPGVRAAIEPHLAYRRGGNLSTADAAGPATYDPAIEDEPLFTSYVGKGGLVPAKTAISASGIYLLLRAYCEKVGMTEPISPHAARVTAIVSLLDEGMDAEEISELSGHRSTRMVRAYDRMRGERKTAGNE